MFGTVPVANVPEYAKKKAYWVCNLVNGVLWFWGAWNDIGGASKSANAMPNGIVVANTEEVA